MRLSPSATMFPSRNRSSDQHMATLQSLTSAASSNSVQGKKALDLLTFAEDESELRRGVGLFQVMAGMGRIFAQSSGSENTYAMSRAANTLKGFLSHNWVVWSGYKFMTLALHYNFAVAWLAVILFWILNFAASAAGLLPTLLSKSAGLELTWLPAIVSTPLFAVVALFARELPVCFLQRGPMVFLDKVCIHQTDLELQALGIRKLGAYLTASERMIILYSDIYFKKLWTVYEVACFLSVRGPQGTDSVTLLPVNQAKAFFAGLACVFLGHVMNAIFSITTEKAFLSLLMPLAASVLMASSFRRWAKEQVALVNAIKTFTIRNCVCQEPGDRPVVYEQVETLMKFQGTIRIDATTEEALDAFDRKLRREMPRALRHMMGGLGFSYPQIMTMSFLISGPFACEYVALPWQPWLAWVLHNALLCVLMWPVAIVALDRGMHHFMHWAGCKEAALVTFAATLFSLYIGGVILLSRMLMVVADQSLAALLCQVALVCAGPVVQWRCARHYSTMASASDLQDMSAMSTTSSSEAPGEAPAAPEPSAPSAPTAPSAPPAPSARASEAAEGEVARSEVAMAIDVKVNTDVIVSMC